MNQIELKNSSSSRVARSLEAHVIVALALGALMYILALSGTLSVFNREFQRWEQPNAPEMKALSPEAAALAAKTVFESEPEPTTHLYINFPQPDLPRTVITTDTQAFFADSEGKIHQHEHFPWTQFLLDLHYYLHLPHILGLTLVGAIGAFLVAMSISGFMAHPRIFRDAFTFRRGADIVPLIDLHNRMSVWTAPFHISNALTGALLGLASVLAFSIAAFNFENDTGKVFDPVFGSEPEAIEGAAPLANIEAPLRFMEQEFPHLPPTYFILHDPATKGQHASIIAKHSDRLIFGDYYHFDSAGNYQGNIGLSDGTLGQQIIGSVYYVHFGSWGGFLVKFAYGVFGLILCVVIASGLRIYFMRRKQKGLHKPKLAAAWEGVIWGTPAVLTFALLVSILARLEGINLIVTFWVGLFLVVSTAFLKANATKTRKVLRDATAILLLLTVLAHTVMNPGAIFSVASLCFSGVLIATSMILAFANLFQNKQFFATKN